MNILLIVDVQNDFVDGALGSPQARESIPNMVKVINQFKNKDDYIFYTLDIHDSNYLNTNEGKHLPIPHCISNTNGWKMNNEIDEAIRNSNAHIRPIIKSTFGSINLAQQINKCYLTVRDKMEITIIGLCTDICVITNALLLKTYFPEAKITVISNACAGTTTSMHLSALEVMEKCHIEIKYDILD